MTQPPDWTEYDRLSDEALHHAAEAARHARKAHELTKQAIAARPPTIGLQPNVGDLLDLKHLHDSATVADLVGGGPS